MTISAPMRLPASRIPPTRVAEIVRLTQEPRPHEATHWTVCAVAKAVGIAALTVQATWKTHGLSPHRFRQFKLLPKMYREIAIEKLVIK